MPHDFSRRRESGVEITDDAASSPHDVAITLQDIRRANTMLGGRRPVVAEALRLTGRACGRMRILDVGAGTGDVGCAVARALRTRGIVARTIAVEQRFVLGAIARPRSDDVIAADALTLPLRDRSVDLVICSQVLHHFDDRRARLLIAELDRVARVGVVIGDLERDARAAMLFRLVAPALRFHPATVRDGLLSIERGFSGAELQALVRSAVPRDVLVRRHFPYRLSASWTIN
jgi:SAM-dependent methyltransferase